MQRRRQKYNSKQPERALDLGKKLAIQPKGDFIMFISLKIWWHKRKARNAYIGYKQACSEYDCGSILTRPISVRAIEYASNFNSAMRELKKLDPKTPDVKL